MISFPLLILILNVILIILLIEIVVLVKKKMIVIDGSLGEGGGQILRLSLGLSVMYMKHSSSSSSSSLRMVNIRSGRKTPGLRAQHVACIRLVGMMLGGGQTSNIQVGTTSFTLHYPPPPQPPNTNTLNNQALNSKVLLTSNVNLNNNLNVKDDVEVFELRTGTAASLTLLIQSALPVMLHRALQSTNTTINTTTNTKINTKIVLYGGTEVNFSPPFDHLKHVLLPLLRYHLLPKEIDVQLTCTKRGFFPKGNGRITLSVTRKEEVNSKKVNSTKAYIKKVNSNANNVDVNNAKVDETSSTSQVGTDRLPDSGNTQAELMLRPMCLMDPGMDEIVSVCVYVRTFGIDPLTTSTFSQTIPTTLERQLYPKLHPHTATLTKETRETNATKATSSSVSNSEKNDKNSSSTSGLCGVVPEVVFTADGYNSSSSPSSSSSRCIAVQVVIATRTGAIFSGNAIQQLRKQKQHKNHKQNHKQNQKNASKNSASKNSASKEDVEKVFEGTLDCAIKDVLVVVESGACVDEHTADQLLVYMAMCTKQTGRKCLLHSCFPKLSKHSMTAQTVIEQLLKTIHFQSREGGAREGGAASHANLILECSKINN